MKKLLCLFIIMSVLLAGCWDNKEVQDINYITALGIDYKEDQYIIYVQMLDFATIARQEGTKQTETAPIWVGRGTGSTLSDALIDLYTANQQRISWGHVTALVLGESVLVPERLSQVFDMTNRSQEIRYTKWIYGTKDSMEDLFTVSPFFQLSPLHSLLHEPQESYRQFSFIRPIQFVNFIRLYREDAATVVLPSLQITTANWTENLKQHPLLEVNGAFLIQHQTLKGWMQRSDLAGIRWLSTPETRASLVVFSGIKAAGSIYLENPKSAIEIIREGEEVYYRIKLNVDGMVQNIYQKTRIGEMKKLTEASLREEIRNTFLKTAAIHADPYQLGLQLRRADPKLWDELRKEKREMHQASLREIDVQVSLRYWGQRKNINR
ncbi:MULTISPECIES: Ger(x)C family spore germination protein [Paenibacillus]|uniref:Germination protein, Ger(X)C family n=2 Tax=Paenibacillus lactis TaxID=228574 RepID=G4HB95_9BACL|nr:Ger(x)C family spore germination protein [Paenibacillus lactis]EHB67204.1 germination protein, Ger(x)C family [Paenibacillus lactis 154]MBP1894458.1 Ger(x)C family germination protein [Paenibacillus lactis]MCM3496163.1 Ger(x)C family spore germination protein [Paenibacillus lactis]GIO94209.1 spore germination protein A3 [Paenibacillus lactis]HAF98689.1 Ger(x)C family spore germination protein [Paenibacillus lactis]